ncbi:hypothetical protein KGO95_01120 [Patescibacteria group bacterium]|nr:hypothetical protein [Patescibacteria group bacterium]
MKYIEATRASDPNELCVKFYQLLWPDIAQVGLPARDLEMAVLAFVFVIKKMGIANKLCLEKFHCSAASIRIVLSAPSEKVRLLTLVPRDAQGNELLDKKDRPILVFPASVHEVNRLIAEGYRYVSMCVLTDTPSEN